MKPKPLLSLRRLQGICKRYEATLNLLPEVTWDRFVGEVTDELGIGAFGWLPRDDGKSDFVFLRIGRDGKAWMVVTSSAKYSSEFSRRLNFPKSEGHTPCKRVEHFFQVTNCARLETAGKPS